MHTLKAGLQLGPTCYAYFACQEQDPIAKAWVSGYDFSAALVGEHTPVILLFVIIAPNWKGPDKIMRAAGMKAIGVGLRRE